MTKQELNRALVEVYGNINCVELQEVKTSEELENANKHFYIVEMEEDFDGKKQLAQLKKERNDAFMFLVKVLTGLGALALLAHLV